MIDVIAPFRHRGLGRLLAMLPAGLGLLLISFPAFARQDDPLPDDDAPAAAAEDAAADDDPEEAEPEEEDRQDVVADSVYIDPLANQIRAETFDELYTGALIPQRTELTIVQQARSRGRPDVGLIDRYIKYCARLLTDQANLDALDAPAGDRSAQGKILEIQQGGRFLMLPFTDVPADQRNAAFYQEYNPRLLSVAAELLQNNLYARTQAMQAVSRMADPRAVGTLIGVLDDAEQPVVVKLLAAEGLRRLARETSPGTLPTAEREKAANALVAFLRNNPDAFWLAKGRALEALGSLRLVSGIQNRDQAAYAAEILGYLSDPEARPETRGWAAWAFGMLEVPPGYPQINYTMAAHRIGLLAIEIGDRIVQLSNIAEAESYNPQRVNYLTGLLVSPIFAALDGAPDIRDSGLRNARGQGPHQQYVTQVHQRIRALTSASVRLSMARGSLIPPARDQVVARLNELRTFIQGNAPENNAIVPGGPTIAMGAADSGDAS